MGRTVTFSPGEFYHIYNRGIEKRDIFLNDRDYQRFQCLLYATNGQEAVDLKLQGRTLYEMEDKRFERGQDLVNVCGYALLPNHYHILVQEKVEGGISTFMRKLGTAYTMYFNAKEERSGVLFQGKFKAKHVEEDSYLKYLLAYIHLNPLSLFESNWKEEGVFDKKKARDSLLQYPFCSFIDYEQKSSRLESKILNRDAFPFEFESKDLYESTTEEFLQGRTLYGEMKGVECIRRA